MLRGHIVVASAITAVMLAGCSSSSPLSLEDGWEWEVRDGAQFELGVDFNYLTGEYETSTSDNGTGLSMASDTDFKPGQLEVALANAQQDMCKAYVEPYGEDPLRSQGYSIAAVMYSTVDAAVAQQLSDEMIAASADVDAFVDANGESLEGLSYGSVEYEAALDSRSWLAVERWDAAYPELADERREVDAYRSELHVLVRTSENVRAIQELFMDKCDITAEDGYEFPTAQDMGLLVGDAWAEQVANSAAS